MCDQVKKYFCPRLLDYIILVGPKESSSNISVDSAPNQQQVYDKNISRVPHLLRRYPPKDHQDFSLPPDVVIFCQPEGCDHVKSSLNAYNNPSQSTNSFVFLLTEKDTSRIRYGVCLNFYRPLQKCPTPAKRKSSAVNKAVGTTKTKEQCADDLSNGGGRQAYATNISVRQEHVQDDRCSQSTADNESGIKLSTGLDSDSVESGEQQGAFTSRPDHSLGQQHNQHQNSFHQHRLPARRVDTNKDRSKITYALNSLCIISHHPFFSTFRECLFIMKKFIQACEDRHLSTPYNDQPDKQPKCRCALRLRGQRVSASQNSHQSHSSRKSASATTAMSHHHTCPYSNPIWSLLTMPNLDDQTVTRGMIHNVGEIESWILRLLSVPVPMPGQTKIELEIMPSSLKKPLLFALPDHTRLSLIDFPLHLPLELLGVETCLQVLTCILLEHKVALQSKDYNALSMSVMAFVTMIYPLEYMFPVIPLLPSYMSSAEQLLLAPTPYIIGFPSSFFKFRPNFTLPNDVWIVDLDANRVKKPSNVEDLPPLPDYEGNILIQNLQKILDSMSRGVDSSVQESFSDIRMSSNTGCKSSIYPTTPKMHTKLAHKEGQTSTPSSPFKRRSSVATAGQLLQFAANKLSGSSTSTSNHNRFNRSSPSSSNRGSFHAVNSTVIPFDPLTILKNNDLDSVDVAVRIAIVNFFNSQEVLANFVEHTRTIRLYPRPVVSFQKSSFIQSRAKISPFLLKLVDTQAIEYLAEWALCPDNVAFQRIQTGVFDPAVIGDKPKWFEKQLEVLRYQILDNDERDFYDDIANLIRDVSCMGSGVTSNVSKFSHYYDDRLEVDPNDADENNDDVVQFENESVGSYDLNVIDDNVSQSSYVSSNIPSPSDTPNRTDTTHPKNHQLGEGRPLSLNDVMNNQMGRMSMSSSESSIESWDVDDKALQTIPANYQHDIERYPPLRCDFEKNYRPCDKLIKSLNEARKWLGTAPITILTGLDSSKANNEPIDSDRKSSYDSSASEDNDGLMKPDSSSCDESGTEEFNFDSINPCSADDTPEALDGADDADVKMFESVDSDTIIAANFVADAKNQLSSDENNNIPDISQRGRTHQTPDEVVGSRYDSDSDDEDPNVAKNLSNTEQNTQHSQQRRPSVTGAGFKSEAVASILNSQKMRVSNGMAKLMGRASSISDSKFLKQNSQPSGQGQSRNLGGEQVGAFFDRFTIEARGAVKEAKAAIDAGKTALKTTAIPVADASRQKLIKNLQNLGENFFDDRRDSVNSSKDYMDDSPSTATLQEGKPQPIAAQDTDRTNQSTPDPSLPSRSTAGKTGTDFNDIAGRANSVISGWLGSKAFALSNRMRDRTRPFGPFPSSKYEYLKA